MDDEEPPRDDGVMALAVPEVPSDGRMVSSARDLCGAALKSSRFGLTASGICSRKRGLAAPDLQASLQPTCRFPAVRVWRHGATTALTMGGWEVTVGVEAPVMRLRVL